MPVGEMILRAWKSAGRRAVSLLGLGWVSAAFYGVAASYFLGHLADAVLVWPRPDAGSLNNFALFYLFCLVVITAFANAVVGMPMTREALEPGNEWKTAYFSVARREWSLFINLLLLYVIVIGLVAAILFAGGVGIAVSLPMIGSGGVWNGIALAPIMSGAITIFAVATGLFLATRFGFFLAPIAAADPPVRLIQAWISSRGNFWRLLTTSLALLVPVVVLILLADWAVLGTKFGDAIAALFSGRDVNPFFRLVQNNTDLIAAIWATAFLVWNAIFSGASADAYSQLEHDVEHATSRERVPVGEPALAMAAASLPAVVVEAERVEPAFTAVEEIKPAVAAPALEEPTAAPEDVNPENRSEGPVVEAAPPVEARASEPDIQAEEIEFKTVEDLPLPVEPIAPAAEAKASGDKPAEGLTATVFEPHEEPLASQETVPPMDPLGNAAPAAPDPAGAETTPLPSFVKTQSSQEREPSEAA